jgi:hypothetical protein
MTQPNNRATLARFEQMLEVLRANYICAGWRMDETEVELALQYFRRLARGGREMAREREAALQFLRDHGQSLDWICDGDVRGMISSAAANSKRAREWTQQVHKVQAQQRAQRKAA